MNISDLAKTVGKFVPAVANAIVPGSGSLISLIAAEFGADEHDTKDIIDKINLSSDARVKLEEIYANCKVQIQQINANAAVAEINANVQNTIDARKMKVDTNSVMPEVLTCIIMIGFIALMWTMIHTELPSTNKDILNIMIGSISAAAGACVQFWVGSSKSSSVKDSIIAGNSK